MTETPAQTIPVYRSLSEVPADLGRTVVAIGNFDGVHRGHREILTSAVNEARAKNAKALAISFDPHPEQFLRPQIAPRLLTLIPERLRLLSATGVDAILVLPFDAALANMRAQEFVEGVLVDRLRVSTLHEGGNFRFGYRAEAGVNELKAFGAQFGFAVHVHSAVCVHGLEISSSAVRALVAAGEMKRARWMLGRPFGVRSTQARGNGREPTVCAACGRCSPAGTRSLRFRAGTSCPWGGAVAFLRLLSEQAPCAHRPTRQAGATRSATRLPPFLWLCAPRRRR